MNSCVNKLRLSAVLILVLSLLTAGRAAAQVTFTNLHIFTSLNNADASLPNGGMVLSGSTLYGTAQLGGGTGNGVVFQINTDGSGYLNLYSFSAPVPDGDPATLGAATNSDGAEPNGGLVLSGDTLYGTTQSGGHGGAGTVFAINTDGTGFTNLYNFTMLAFDAVAPSNNPVSFANNSRTNSDGASPMAGLILSGSTLYGTASLGGSGGSGTVFALHTDGTGFAVLASFDSIAFNPVTLSYQNADGFQPVTHLVISGSTLYGTTSQGGSAGNGTLYSLGTGGNSFAVLHEFSTIIDGASPNALTVSGNTLYGTTAPINPTFSGAGTVFTLDTDGTGFTTLTNFVLDSGGYFPFSDLILSSNILYGTARLDASNYAGTVFAVGTDGTGLSTLFTFAQRQTYSPVPGFRQFTNSDGMAPNGLLLANNTLYGTTYSGGALGAGTVFSLSSPNFRLATHYFAPVLGLAFPGGNAVLSWRTNAAVFNLQSATSLTPPVAWRPVSPAPSIVNGQYTSRYTVTNPVLGARAYYRLSQ